MWDVALRMIGPDGRAMDLSPVQMVVRAGLVFLVAVALVRVGSRRFMGRESAMDLILAILLGSVLSRAINGQAPLGSTLLASAAMVAIHAALAFAAMRWRGCAWLLKGEPTMLVEHGRQIERAMQDAMVSHGDLLEAVRLRGRAMRLEDVEFAYLERDGRISIILKGESKV